MSETDTPVSPRNVDPAELAQFNELAAQWWDRHGPMRALHLINPLRLQVIDEVVAVRGRKVCDVGCGGGILAEALARAGADVTALDLSTEVLEVARRHATDAGLAIDYREQAVEELAAEMPEQFDVLTCMEMLEHVPAPESVIAACAKLVRPGGYLVFSTLNRHPMSFVQAIVGAEYVLKMVPRGTHEYRKFIRPSELARGCRDNGLDVLSTRGLSYNPLTQAFTLNRDLRVNYFLAAQKP